MTISSYLLNTSRRGAAYIGIDATKWRNVMKKQPNSFFVFTLLVLVALPVLGSFSPQQTAGELFEKALFIEEGQGDLRKAIEIYEKVLAQFPKDRETAAKAQLHVGLCYEKLGVGEALKAFRKVIEAYPEQTTSVSLARQRLALLSKGGAAQDTELKIRKVLEGEGVGMDFYGSVSPDGRYISGPDTEKEWNPAIRDLATGEIHCLTHHEGGYSDVSGWSPDGKRLFYTWWYYSDLDRSELRIVGVDGSDEKTIRSGKGTYIDPFAWSPDGTKILAQIREPEKTDLCLISVKNGAIQVLKSHPGSRPVIPIWMGCVFSPDGRSVAYAREPMPERSYQRDIYILSLDTGKETLLVEHPASEYFLGWSRDGKHILFASDRTGSIGIWSAEVEEGALWGKLRLIKDNVGPIVPLGVTRDNAFFYGYLPGESDIYLAEMDPASGRVISRPRKLDLPFEGHNDDPSYSLDGRRLAYVSNRGVRRIIFNNVLGIHDFSSGKDKVFDPKLMTFHAPRWTPDGQAINIMGYIEPNEWALYRVDAETGNRRTMVAPEKDKDVYSSDWSPDGKPLYYLEALSTKETGILDNRVIEFKTDTGQKRELYRFNSVNSTVGLFAVSPDGEKLAFVQRPGDPTGDTIFCLPATGGEAKAVVKNRSIRFVVWSPDSKFVVFCASNRADNELELMRVPADGGEIQKLGLDISVTKRKSHFPFSIRPDGRQIAFASGGENERQPEVWVMENLFPRTKP
jgi:Tol biopolymer transport system component